MRSPHSNARPQPKPRLKPKPRPAAQMPPRPGEEDGEEEPPLPPPPPPQHLLTKGKRVKWTLVLSAPFSFNRRFDSNDHRYVDFKGWIYDRLPE